MTVTVMDRHFMHLAGIRLTDLPDQKLNIQIEKPNFLGQTEGFGPYSVDLDRAIHLTSCHDTLRDPDAVIRYLPHSNLCLWMSP